ncbi:replication protein P [Serratia symbiotica]|uniref:Putative Replication protein P family protein n=1 Tax=Serratia symbiotica SCt-VLC TaxID=1347341 RepID=A0A068RDL0_9GAMM|nr:replication protein P [Serratia symbiotica]CDG48938.1 Putative Replication protein P family protein [Serratia symbiotica SCt-VLC]
MKKLISAVNNRDSGVLASMMDHQQKRVVNAEAKELVDALFENLLLIFPAAQNTVLKTADDVAAMKRQWILAFAENGIRHVDQLRAGMRMARHQESDFWPSCGKFISWCRESGRVAAGLPSDEDVMAEFQRYARNHDRYSTPETYPWTHDVMYWVVLDVRRLMHKYNYTEAEVSRSIKSHMRKWERELNAGRAIPKPMKQLADKRRPPAAADILDPDGIAGYEQVGKAFLAHLREKST